MSFYTYENWVHRYARVHRGECSHCNQGHGSHAAVNSHAGQWHGAFGSYAEARDAGSNTGFEVTDCRVCAPG